MRQHGNVTRAQLLALGAGPTRSRTGRSGQLLGIHLAVYAVGRPATLPLERAAAAVLACDPAPRTNARVLVFEVDGRFTAQQLPVELDGWGFHRDRDAFERDRERDATLAAHGVMSAALTCRWLVATPVEAERLHSTLRRRSIYIEHSSTESDEG